MFCMGFCCWVFVFFLVFLPKSNKNGLGWREGTAGLVGFFSFPLAKDWFLFKLVQEGGGRGVVKVGIFALEGGSGQALCDCGVECLHDVLYQEIDRMFITDVSYLPPKPAPPPKNKRQDFS